MLVNKRRDMTPFDMNKKPMKQQWYLMPLLWGGSFIMTRQFKWKIEKIGMEKLKPPFLVLSTHQGFADYYITPLALFPHRANYVSDMEGFAAFGEFLYRAIGCIGKRRYVSDFTVVKNIKYALDKKQIAVVYPESRHSNVGTTAYIPPNMGKLVKMMKVPLVILSVHGSYLANPFWDEEHTRKVPIKAKLECVYTTEEIAQKSTQEIQKTIQDRLQYDEYKWQQESGIAITEPKRAEGLHHALYQCKRCGENFHMESKGTILSCEKCGTKWEMSELGNLQNEDGNIHIPDWYEWQREQVKKEINDGQYAGDFEVSVEALPNAKGFIPMGKGTLSHKSKGFYLKIAEQELFFDHCSRESVQTEYNYRGKGPCIVLSTQDCCYYIYAEDKQFSPTRIQFAGEYYHQKEMKKR